MRNRLPSPCKAALLAWLLAAAQGHARESSPAARGARAIEDLLGRMDASALTGQVQAPGGPALELPAPPPAILNDEEPELVARQVLVLSREIASENGLRGHEHFEKLYEHLKKHPDPPKIKAVLKAPQDLSNLWYPELGPVRYWQTSYSPTEDMPGPPLHSVEIQIDKALAQRISEEVGQVYGGGFKSVEDRAKRIALFLAPKALADMETARIMDEQELPNYVRADAIEELRLIYELAALKSLVVKHVLADPGFKLLPSEREYLESRLGVGGNLRPSQAFISEKARERWEAIREKLQMLVPLLRLESEDGEDADQLAEGNRRSLETAFTSMLNMTGRLAYNRMSALQLTQGWLNRPGYFRELQQAAREERERAIYFLRKDLPPRAADVFSMHYHVASARAEAERLDDQAMDFELRQARNKALKAGLTLNTEALREGLARQFLTLNYTIKSLSHPEAEVRQRACERLRDMEPAAKEALTALSLSLQSDLDPKVRTAAAAALGKMGREAIPALARALRDILFNVRIAAADALAAMGEEALPALSEAMEDPRAEGWPWLALRKMGPAAVPILIKASRSREDKIREGAARALSDMKPTPKEAPEVLKELFLKDKNSDVRFAAFNGLKDISPDDLPLWIEALRNDEWGVRYDACDGLWSAMRHGVDISAAAPYLIQAMAKKDIHDLTFVASLVLKNIGPAAVPELVKALKSDRDWVREAAIDTLKEIGPAAKEALPALEEIKNGDRKPALQDKAAAAINKIRTKKKAYPDRRRWK